MKNFKCTEFLLKKVFLKRDKVQFLLCYVQVSSVVSLVNEFQVWVNSVSFGPEIRMHPIIIKQRRFGACDTVLPLWCNWMREWRKRSFPPQEWGMTTFNSGSHLLVKERIQNPRSKVLQWDLKSLTCIKTGFLLSVQRFELSTLCPYWIISSKFSIG